MSKKEDEFRQRLAAAFRVEAAEHIAAISSGLSVLDSPSTPGNAQEIIETTFREMHTLKGAARSVNENEIESLCQGAESALSALRHGRISFTRALADLIFLALGKVNAIIEGNRGGTGPSTGFVTTHDLITALEREANGEHVPLLRENHVPSPAVSLSNILPATLSPRPSLPGQAVPVAMTTAMRKVPEINSTIRVPVSKMDAILNLVEELVAQKESLNRNVQELDEIALLLDAAKKEWLRFSVDIAGLRTTSRARGPSLAVVSGLSAELSGSGKLADFSRQNNRTLQELEIRLAAGSVAGRRELHAFNRQVDTLLSEVREVMLVPAASVLMFLNLSVQEMSASMGKEAGLVISGGEHLVDRRILEGMKDPLIHLVRNAVNHGIESPDERKRAGKPVKGTITVSLVEKGGNRIELVISDDGRGIDFALVKAAALKQGIAEAGELERMGESGIIRLLFRSGLSTSPIITDLSGRGIGLSIVEEQVEMFDGDVTIQTRRGKGTRVRITLPVRLSMLRGIIVRARDCLFIIPRVYAVKVQRVDEISVQRLEDHRMIRNRNETIPLISLAAFLALPHSSAQTPARQTRYAVVITSGATRIALEVDEVIREQEFSQKCLGPQLTRVRNIAGAAIGSGGTVIPVLNIVDLVKTVSRGGLVTEPEGVIVAETAKVWNLLVVEDSITARTLLKNILEGAGYAVKTAVDGMDALTVLKTDQIDLVVSDIEMPRMNGFDLTTAIRHDRNLAELPVVLVTALASREDRERGIDAGANAYIVKSSFDQGNLLDIIGRLIG
jgi:two-component system chemotaxis sensor kinase CheA